MCHLVLSLERLLSFGADDGRDRDLSHLRTQLLRRYIRFLVQERRLGQVAWYTAKIDDKAETLTWAEFHDKAVQAETYVEFLETVAQREDREMGEKLMELC